MRALLQERKERRKEELDASRRDVQFAVEDEGQLDTEHTPLPSRSLLSPRLMGPFRVLARTALNTYRLDLPATRRVFPELNVERLRTYLRGPDRLGGDSDAGPTPPAAGPHGVPEHEMQELLKFKLRYDRPYVLVRWTGLDAAGDTWEPLDNLTNCEDAIAAFEQANGRSLPRPAPPPPNGTAVTPPPIEPTGFTVEAAPPGDLGAALVGRIVARRLLAARHRRSPLPARRLLARGGLQTADIGAARHGGHAARRRLLRLPLLSPALAVTVVRALRPRAPDHKFEYGRWLVTAPGPGPGSPTFA